MFEKTLIAGWGDMDFNAHMRNTAFLDKSADLRMMFFAEQGFPMARFVELRVGPVVARDEVDYYREVGLLEPIRATLELAGLADDSSRFILRNEFFLADGKRAARITSTGGWLDLAARRLIVAPEAVLAALRALTTTADFRTLDSSVK